VRYGAPHDERVRGRSGKGGPAALAQVAEMLTWIFQKVLVFRFQQVMLLSAEEMILVALPLIDLALAATLLPIM